MKKAAALVQRGDRVRIPLWPWSFTPGTPEQSDTIVEAIVLGVDHAASEEFSWICVIDSGNWVEFRKTDLIEVLTETTPEAEDEWEYAVRDARGRVWVTATAGARPGDMAIRRRKAGPWLPVEQPDPVANELAYLAERHREKDS